jgi:hypothetical protein
MRRPVTVAGTSVAAITSFGAMSHLAGGHALSAKARLATAQAPVARLSQHNSAICRDFVGWTHIRAASDCCPFAARGSVPMPDQQTKLAD